MEMESLELTRKIVEILNDKKAQDIEVLTISKVSTITDYFVICTGNSSTQVKSLADEVDFKLGQMGREPYHIEGMSGDTWILLDYSDVIVHIFHKESRAFYSLERLWSDATKLDISKILDK